MFLRWVLEDIWKHGNYSRSGIKKDRKLISGISNEVSKVLSFEEIFSESGIALVKAGYRVDRVAHGKLMQLFVFIERNLLNMMILYIGLLVQISILKILVYILTLNEC